MLLDFIISSRPLANFPLLALQMHVRGTENLRGANRTTGHYAESILLVNQFVVECGSRL